MKTIVASAFEIDKDIMDTGKKFPDFGPENIQISGSVNFRVPRNYVPTNRKCGFSGNLIFLYKYRTKKETKFGKYFLNGII